MDREELFKIHEGMCKAALDISRKKNADYSKGKDALGNFWVCEATQVATAEQGILVRIGDKISRLASVTEKGCQVLDESELDTALDIINYVVLFMAVREERRKKSGLKAERYDENSKESLISNNPVIEKYCQNLQRAVDQERERNEASRC